MKEEWLDPVQPEGILMPSITVAAIEARERGEIDDDHPDMRPLWEWECRICQHEGMPSFDQSEALENLRTHYRAHV